MKSGLALALVLVEVFAYGAHADDRAMAAVLAVCTLAAWLSPWIPAPRRAVWVLAAVELAAAIPRLVGLYTASNPSLVPLGDLLLLLRDAMIWMQITLLLLQPASLPRAARHPALFVLFGVVAMVGSGCVEGSTRNSPAYQLAIICFCAFAIAYAWPTRQGQRLALGTLLLQLALFLVAAAGGYGSSEAVAKHGNQIDAYLMQALNPPVQSVGFSRNSTLNSINNLRGKDEVIALRVYAESPPGYLRACAYDTYLDQRWGTTPDGKANAQVVGEAEDGRKIFRIGIGATSPDAKMEVWQEGGLDEVLFLPMHASTAAASATMVGLDAHQSALPEQLRTAAPIDVTVNLSEQLAPPTRELRELLLAIPASLTPRAGEIAAEVTATARTPEQKMLRVQAYFGQTYDYSLELHVPDGQEPLNYFLETKAAAHCEYFAAGATMLLRLVGVPCRYVTGFVAAEESRFGNYWIARNRDAHDWVEAYDDEAGVWRIVEATPASGVPTPRESAIHKALFDYLRQRLRELIAMLRAQSLQTLLLTLVGVAAGTAGMVAGAAWLWRALQRWRRKPVKPAHLRALHRELAIHDRLLRRQGLRRGPHETLHQFAARIERERPELQSEAAWYRAYAVSRYSAAGATVPPGAAAPTPG
jgi:hypothetical protein